MRYGLIVIVAVVITFVIFAAIVISSQQNDNQNNLPNDTGSYREVINTILNNTNATIKIPINKTWIGIYIQVWYNTSHIKSGSIEIISPNNITFANMKLVSQIPNIADYQAEKPSLYSFYQSNNVSGQWWLKYDIEGGPVHLVFEQVVSFT